MICVEEDGVGERVVASGACQQLVKQHDYEIQGNMQNLVYNRLVVASDGYQLWIDLSPVNLSSRIAWLILSAVKIWYNQIKFILNPIWLT
jgi:hypothetical protein